MNHLSLKFRAWLTVFSLPLLLCTCAQRPHDPQAPMGERNYPKKIRLPERIKEASGLVIEGDRFRWHNDSGDGPYVYNTDRTGRIVSIDTMAADASDWEDITSDPTGRLYVADTGNNRGQRTELAIYRYDKERQITDTITLHYPGQDGAGRQAPGNYDCEAVVFQGGYLHLFTKDRLGGRGGDNVYHFRTPATPGNYEAELVDSLHLPRRVVTAAAIDTVRRRLVMTAYTFKMVLGFLPTSAASLITISDYEGHKFLSGDLSRRNLSWGAPTQFEAVDFVNDDWLYVASEATVVQRRAKARLLRRR